MKYSLLSFLAVALLVGCATPSQVSRMEGHGVTEIYAAPYDQVWRAAVDAAQVGGLQVRTADREHGYIGASRGIQPTTFGENVGIWVRDLAPDRTQVEVVSRQAGPPALWMKNWQRDVFTAVRANLTREAGENIANEAAGAEPPVATPRLVPEQALPPVAPPRY